MSRARCPTCHTRTGRSTLAANGGICKCGFDIFRKEWYHQISHIGLEAAREYRDQIYDIAKEHGIAPSGLINLALRTKLFAWSANPESIKDDLMLSKLVKD